MIMHSACAWSIFALTICTIGEHMNDQKATKSHGLCAYCGSDTVMSTGNGRALVFRGVTVALPKTFEYERCYGCGTCTLTREQTEQLHELVASSEIGFGRHGEPVTRGT